MPKLDMIIEGGPQNLRHCSSFSTKWLQHYWIWGLVNDLKIDNLWAGYCIVEMRGQHIQIAV
jgi:hypothetical protein